GNGIPWQLTTALPAPRRYRRPEPDRRRPQGDRRATPGRHHSALAARAPAACGRGHVRTEPMAATLTATLDIDERQLRVEHSGLFIGELEPSHYPYVGKLRFQAARVAT